jgi:hypothetical protein
VKEDPKHDKLVEHTYTNIVENQNFNDENFKEFEKIFKEYKTMEG